MTKELDSSIWVFTGPKRFPGFPSAVFIDLQLGEQWVQENNATGTFTQYPINMSVYDWAINNGRFTPRKEEHKQPTFIENFTSAYTGHFHYVQGIKNGTETKESLYSGNTLANYPISGVWVFTGPKRFPGFPSAVFIDLQLGEQWVQENNATGTFTQYPINMSVYDWAVSHRLFVPKNVEQTQSQFIESFSSTRLEHYHYYVGHLSAA